MHKKIVSEIHVFIRGTEKTNLSIQNRISPYCKRNNLLFIKILYILDFPSILHSTPGSIQILQLIEYYFMDNLQNVGAVFKVE
jgi:hypothetical protein